MKKIILAFYCIICSYYVFCQELSLVSPSNNVSLTNQQVIFNWNKSISTNSIYKLQISPDSNFNLIAIDTLTSLNNITLNLSHLTNQHLYWRVEDTSSNNISNIRYFYCLDFSAYPNVPVWLKSDSVLKSNDTIIEWYNLGDTNFHFIQNNISRRPTYINSSLNNYPSVNFNGTQVLDGDKNILTNKGNEFYAVTVIEPNSSGINFIYDQGFFGSKGSGAGLSSSDLSFYLSLAHGGINTSVPINNTSESLLNVSIGFNTGTLQTQLNNTPGQSATHSVIAANSTTISTNNEMVIGGQAKTFSSSRCFKGEMFELILLNDTVYEAEIDRNIIPNYLHNKYSPYPNLGEDIIPYALCQTSFEINPGNHFDSYFWNTGDADSSILVNESGEYSVVVFDVFGFTLRDTIQVKLPFTPLQDTISVCFGDSATLSLNIGSFYSFNWSNGSANSSISVINPGLYYVEVIDTFGCSFKDSTYFIVDSFSSNPTLGPDRVFCLNSELSLDNLDISSSSISYQWSTLETTSSIVLDFSADTLIFVNAINGNSCVFRDSIQANINNIQAPVVDFVSDTACPGFPTHFQSTSIPFGNDIISIYEWSFPNGSNGSGMVNSDYIHSNLNSYFVELTVETDSSCVNSNQKEVFIFEPPKPNFISDIQCFGQNSSFADFSVFNGNDSIISWFWLFNGKDTSLIQNPTTILDSVGLNSVKLIIQDLNLCIDSITKTIEIFPALLPDFEAEQICIGDTTLFTDITPSFSTIDRTWIFDFFGQTSTNPNPYFYYPNPGIYDVKLSLTNAIGCQSEVVKSIEIRDLPEVDLVYDNTCEDAESALFDASSTDSGFITSQTWIIDGEELAGDSVYYTFEDLGFNPVFLSVTDNFNCSNDTSILISVYPLPQADFDFSPNYGEAPIDIQFENLSSTDAVDFLWSFGDTSINAIDENPINTYNQNGVYEITLAASTLEGCTDSTIQTIAIIPTALDIKLSDFSIQKVDLGNGMTAYKPSVLMQNVGTRAIFNADLFLSINSETQIAETWEGVIPIGQSALYELGNFAIIENESILDYVCIEAQHVNDNTELNFANNKTCLVQNGSLKTSELYPNPAEETVHIDVIPEDDGESEIGVFDLLGKVIIPLKKVTLMEGFNQISINTTNLVAGKYIVQLIYQEEIYSYSLIIHNR